MECCPAHVCKCGRRGKIGRECTWRRLLAEFIASDSMAAVVSKTQGTLTYLQVLELHARHGLENPRRRLLINLIAVRPEAQPLNDTFDGRRCLPDPIGDLHSDGDTPVFTTSSYVWV